MALLRCPVPSDVSHCNALCAEEVGGAFDCVAQDTQLPESPNLRVLVALRNLFAALSHSAGLLPSRAASPFAGAMLPAALNKLVRPCLISPFLPLTITLGIM